MALQDNLSKRQSENVGSCVLDTQTHTEEFRVVGTDFTWFGGHVSNTHHLLTKYVSMHRFPGIQKYVWSVDLVLGVLSHRLLLLLMYHIRTYIHST